MQRFVHALRGIAFAVRREANLWFHFSAAVAVFVTAFWLQLSLSEWAILSLTVGLVIAAELVNTAIEQVVDLASPEFHELAKRAKDTAAGAVFAAAVTSVVVGGCLLGPPLWKRIVL